MACRLALAMQSIALSGSEKAELKAAGLPSGCTLRRGLRTRRTPCHRIERFQWGSGASVDHL